MCVFWLHEVLYLLVYFLPTSNTMATSFLFYLPRPTIIYGLRDRHHLRYATYTAVARRTTFISMMTTGRRNEGQGHATQTWCFPTPPNMVFFNATQPGVYSTPPNEKENNSASGILTSRPGRSSTERVRDPPPSSEHCAPHRTAARSRQQHHARFKTGCFVFLHTYGNSAPAVPTTVCNAVEQQLTKLDFLLARSPLSIKKRP